MMQEHQPGPRENAIPTLNESVVVRWLIGLCMVLYALNKIFTAQAINAAGQPVSVGLRHATATSMSPRASTAWSCGYSYQFLHGNLLHLGMNMMALYVFGPLIEKWWGPRQFLAFYLLCGACGASSWRIRVQSRDYQRAACLACRGLWLGLRRPGCLGDAVPQGQVKLIIPPMWVTVRKLAILFIALSIGSMFVGYNAGGNAAHIGGAIFGYLLVKRPWSLDFVDRDAPPLEPPGSGGSKPGEGDA